MRARELFDLLKKHGPLSLPQIRELVDFDKQHILDALRILRRYELVIAIPGDRAKRNTYELVSGAALPPRHRNKRGRYSPAAPPGKHKVPSKRKPSPHIEAAILLERLWRK